MIAFVLVSDSAKCADCYVFSVEVIPIEVVAYVNMVEYSCFCDTYFTHWAWAFVEASKFLFPHAYLFGDFETWVALGATLETYVYVLCARFAVQVSVFAE